MSGIKLIANEMRPIGSVGLGPLTCCSHCGLDQNEPHPVDRESAAALTLLGSVSEFPASREGDSISARRYRTRKKPSLTLANRMKQVKMMCEVKMTKK